jgi:hypothetical protein
MSTYVVYEHPRLGHRLETTDANAVVAFLFAPCWLLIKGLYIGATLSFAALFVTLAVLAGIDRSADRVIRSVLSTPQEVLNENERYKEIYWQRVEPASADLSPEEMLAAATKLYAQERAEQQAAGLRPWAILVWIPMALAHLAVCMHGGDWVRKNLERRGFRPVATIEAPTRDALLRALTEQGKLPTDATLKAVDSLGFRIFVAVLLLLVLLVVAAVVIPIVATR